MYAPTAYLKNGAIRPHFHYYDKKLCIHIITRSDAVREQNRRKWTKLPSESDLVTGLAISNRWKGRRWRRKMEKEGGWGSTVGTAESRRRKAEEAKGGRGGG